MTTDNPYMTLTPEDQFILGSVKIKATQTDLDWLNNLIPLIKHWETMLQLAVERGIGPLMYQKLSLLKSSHLIPVSITDSLQQVYYRTLRRGMILQDAMAGIQDVFGTNQLVYIPLKGIFLSEWLYADIGLRQFSDIDLLIKPEEGKRAVSLLKEMGYVARDYNALSEFIESKSDKVHYPPMILNFVSVELHTKLHRDTESYHVNPESCWEKAVPAQLNGRNISTFQVYDLLIHLCVHLDKHFREGKLQFSSFNDITNLIDIHCKTMDWNEFGTRCTLFKCEVTVMKYLLLVHKYFNIDLPEELLQSHSGLLKESDEELFINYLHGYAFEKETVTQIPGHLENLRKLDTGSDYIKYIFQLIFPPKKFMIEKYIKQLIIKKEEKQLNVSEESKYVSNFEIKKKKLKRKLLITNYELLIKCWWLWYPYRWLVGAKGLVKLIVNSKQ